MCMYYFCLKYVPDMKLQIKKHQHKNIFEYFRGEIHSVPSYKERSYKERLVEMLQSKEQRLVEI